MLLRDTLSPLGYDVVALSSESVDLHLYASDVEIQLTFDGESSLAQLLLRLELRRVATGPEGLSPRRLPPVVCLMVRRGLGEALVEFLHHAGARAAAAMVDVPHRSGAAPEPKLWLFRVEQPPERLAGLFARTPGITAFFPVGDNLAVAAGFQHPVHLDACGRVFGEGRMVFFHPPPDPPRLFATMPQLHPISDLVRMPAPIPVAGSAQLSAVTPIDVRTRVHLVRVPPRPEAPVATLVPWTQAQWVQKLAASLPMAALSKYRIAALEQGLLIVAPENLQWFPFGILLTLAARGVLVPVGFQLRPAISRGLLEERLATRDGSVVVFPAVGAPPFRVADADLAPLENQVLGPILVNLSPAHTQTPAQAEEAPPEVRYSRGLIMPLWGG